MHNNANTLPWRCLSVNVSLRILLTYKITFIMKATSHSSALHMYFWEIFLMYYSEYNT